MLNSTQAERSVADCIAFGDSFSVSNLFELLNLTCSFRQLKFEITCYRVYGVNGNFIKRECIVQIAIQYGILIYNYCLVSNPWKMELETSIYILLFWSQINKDILNYISYCHGIYSGIQITVSLFHTEKCTCGVEDEVCFFFENF